MNIRKSLGSKSILLDLKSETKDGIITEMLDHLVSIGDIPRDRHDEVLNALFERERKMSTGMQNGVAIPHAKTDAVDHLVTALALKRDGIDFNSLDGEPSRIFVMTVSPRNRTGPHIQFLAEISRLLSDADRQKRILSAASVPEILQLI